MTQIDHDPNEPKIDRSDFPWWAAWVMVAFVWVCYLSFHVFDWYSIAVGGLTVGILTGWAVDTTGNKVPDSWRKKR